MGTSETSVLRIQTRVLPGKKIEVSTPDLSVGDEVEVSIIPSPPPTQERRSVLDIIENLPGGSLFKTSLEADEYLQAERDAWDR
jgi:hypothetical protein